ncbi:hypothetical protein CCACVL1_30510 [Corchorus capsularis]|uniref:Uncharacterized protein n=1 Tax=Corchorus capsularis TaxID=210143 RepID=A0A1R3FWU4_COCAP|nr:hypothetical protein CCACVL1_30510 [Corchorus capsularis]
MNHKNYPYARHPNDCSIKAKTSSDFHWTEGEIFSWRSNSIIPETSQVQRIEKGIASEKTICQWLNIGPDEIPPPETIFKQLQRPHIIAAIYDFT